MIITPKNTPPMRLFCKRLSIPALLGFAILTGGPASADTTFLPAPESERFRLSVVGLEGVIPDTAPVTITKRNIRYPMAAEDFGREGWVIVEMDIDEEGVPYNTEIVSSQAGSMFHRSALNALQDFRFAPATLDGKAVAVEGKRFKVSYSFTER